MLRLSRLANDLVPRSKGCQLAVADNRHQIDRLQHGRPVRHDHSDGIAGLDRQDRAQQSRVAIGVKVRIWLVEPTTIGMP